MVIAGLGDLAHLARAIARSARGSAQAFRLRSF
jgi:hypothetical protein